MKEFPIIELCYDFTVWMNERIRRFPRNERYSIGLRVENKLLDFLDTLVEARYTRKRAEILRRAVVQLECLRFHVRLLRDLGLFNSNRYEYASEKLLEIGRQLGGWMKAGGSDKDEERG